MLTTTNHNLPACLFLVDSCQFYDYIIPKWEDQISLDQFSGAKQNNFHTHTRAHAHTHGHTIELVNLIFLFIRTALDVEVSHVAVRRYHL